VAQGRVKTKFLCPACRHVHGYSAPDIQLMLPYTDPRRAPLPTTSLTYDCNARCKAALPSYAFAHSWHSINAWMKRRRQCWRQAKRMRLRVANGHSLNGPIVHKSLAFDVHLDEDWETGDGWNRRAPARLSA